MQSTGLVLWECSNLLGEYVGYATWLGGPSDEGTTSMSPVEERSRNWWMVHPPAPVVPGRFWSAQRLPVLELGGGCGAISALLATLGARVVCTDGDVAALQTARLNCREAKTRHGSRSPLCKEETSTAWGSVDFRLLRWGCREDAQQLVRDLGPFGHIVGSDLLYGDTAPPEPLLETLVAITEEQRGHSDLAPSAAGLITLAIKNRCGNEIATFCRQARERHLWHVELAEQEDLPANYRGRASGFYGAEDSPAYGIIHLRALREESRPVKKLRGE